MAMIDTESSTGNSALTELSTMIEDAVELGGMSTVTVYGRRRLPASGIMWSSEGAIVTANHVVERDDDVRIGLPSGDQVPVTVQGRDLRSDIALLRPENGATLTNHQAERSARNLRPGTIVLALGRPNDGGIRASFGTVSGVGMTSGSDRESNSPDFVQSTVAMLPGFSGGSLIDPVGRLIGMNSSHLSGGMTLTTRYMETVVASLAEHGKVRSGYLGIGAQSVQLPASVPLPEPRMDVDRGLMIVAVESEGPAARDGLMLGDVILLVDADHVPDVESLQALLSGDRVSSEVTMTILRAGQVERKSVTVGERK